MRTVIVAIQKNGTIAIHGLAPDEEDDLYEQLEAKFGHDEVDAIVGVPYVVSVLGASTEDVREFVKGHCERLGWRVTA